MSQQFNLSEMIKKNIESRVKDAIYETKEEAKKILEQKIDQLATDVAIEINQSQLVAELAQEISVVIHK